jgi:hypothetical protein
MGCCWPSIEEEEQVNIDVSNSLDIVNEVVDFENDAIHETNDLSVVALEDSISSAVKQAEEHLPLTKKKGKPTKDTRNSDCSLVRHSQRLRSRNRSIKCIEYAS